jgi:glycosyltransferase XagB
MRPIVHTPHRPQTAARLLSAGQVMLAVVLFLLAIAVAAAFGPVVLLKVGVAAAIAFYIVFVGFKFIIWYAAGKSAEPRYPLPAQDDPDLPPYTILVPLRGEANMIGELVKALSSLRYPAEKLQILLLLEKDDAETQAAAAAMDLPGCFGVLIAPDAGPRTKPKACNFGYTHATGTIATIFDAEDRPEPDQLLKAVAGFRAVPAGGPRVGCLQARLVFWNPRGSWISSFYWAEYVTHFRWVLAGMARLGLIPPLGGTSNHFSHDALEAVSAANGRWEFTDGEGNPVTMRGPWDPYNVTEDADLAFRLAMAGYQIGMLDSVTYEEAPDTAASYLHQQEYGLTFRLLFTPLWWAFTSISAYRALRKLLIRSQRSSWDKTPHGHELAREAELARHDRLAVAAPAA